MFPSPMGDSSSCVTATECSSSLLTTAVPPAARQFWIGLLGGSQLLHTSLPHVDVYHMYHVEVTTALVDSEFTDNKLLILWDQWG